MKRNVVSLSAATVILLLIGLIFSGVGGAQATPLTSGGPPDTLPARVQPIPQYVPESSAETTSNIVGSGVVTITDNIVGFGSPPYLRRIITLLGVPSTGWTFTSWRGSISSTLSFTSATFLWSDISVKVVTATFSAIPYTLFTDTVGSGSVAIDPQQETYTYSDAITLTATPDLGWQFAGWIGDLVSSDNPAHVIITGNTQITATFNQPTYTLNTSVVGGGLIFVDPEQEVYHNGDVVTLTADAYDPCWGFTSWSGDISGSDIVTTFVIVTNTSVTATFDLQPIAVDITVVGLGTVYQDPDEETYLCDAGPNLYAIASTGWYFVGWSGAVTGTADLEPLGMTGLGSPVVITATFAPITYHLDVETAGQGTVAKDPAQATYIYNDVVTLTANPKPGWYLLGWSGDVSGALNPTTVTIYANTMVTATFRRLTYTLDVDINGVGDVAVDPVKATYHYGDVVTLTASTDDCNSFVGWSGGATGSDLIRTISITGHTVVTATFETATFTITNILVGNGWVTAYPGLVGLTCGQVVTLVASPATGWDLEGWSGAASGSAYSVTVVISGQDEVVTTTFYPISYTLDVDIVGVGSEDGGSVGLDPDQDTFIYDTVVTLTASPDPGWYLVGWSGAASGSDLETTVTIYANTVVTATFAQLTYTLGVDVAVDVVGAGSVTIEPEQETYLYGEVVTLTASSEPCYTFIGWSGDLSGSELVQVITITSNMVITATFNETLAIITRNVVGNGFVTVQPAHPFVTCGDDLTFTASAYIGWYFAGWSGDVSGPGTLNPVAMTISEPTVEVTATFEPYSYSLVIETVGKGSVSKDPDLAAYIYNDVVTLTANPEPGWYLFRWSGDVSGNSNPQAVTIQGNTMVTATFRRLTYTLDVDINGIGDVDVNPVKPTYFYGDVVTLTASTDSCNVLQGWSGDATGSELVKVISITGHTAITATFVPATYTITTDKVGSGFITAQLGTTGLVCNTFVTLTATPADGWDFDGWSGDVTSEDNPITVTISGQNQLITATFIPITYTLKVDTIGNGSVARNPVQTTYIYNDVVTLTASPDPGWYLVGWSGAASGSDLETTVTIYANTVVTATFAQITYTLDVDVVGDGNVVVDPVKTTYLYGDVVTLTASTDNCHHLTAWSGSLTGSELVQVYTVTSNMVVTATFDLTPADITLNEVGSGFITAQPAHPVLVCGDALTLTATPSTGWYFVGWSGDVSGDTNPTAMTISDPVVVVTATFAPYTYSLVVNTVGQGSVAKDPAQTTYIYNDVVTLTASPEPGWYLFGWSGAVSGTSNPSVVTIHANTVVTATFKLIINTLRDSDIGTGSVVADPTQATYRYGDVVTLTASTDSCHSLTAWSGSLTGNELVKVYTVTSNMVVTATFDLTPAVIKTNVLGNGSVLVQPDPAAHLLTCGSVITVSALAQPGWDFVSWSGAVSGTANPASMMITDPNVVITATFKPTQFLLQVDTIGNGSVAKDPAQSSYIYNDVVTLTAIPNPGWYLIGWSGAASGNANPKAITINANTIVTATFGQITYTLSVIEVGTGDVAVDPVKTTYLYGDVVTLTASTDVCHSLTAWSGSLTGSSLVQVYTVTSNMVVTATFDLTPAVTTIIKVGNGFVTVQPAHPVLVCGDVLTLTASSASGWSFVGWSGAVSSDENPAVLTISDPNVVITATFEPTQYLLRVDKIGNGSVARDPSQGSYIYNDVVTLTAIPDPGWYLIGWSGAASGKANPKAITIRANTLVTATFGQITYTLSTHVVGIGNVDVNPTKATYLYGDVVTLTASTDVCHSLTAWSGSLTGNELVKVYTVTSNMVVTATFDLTPAVVTKNVVGKGIVLHQPSHPNLVCGDAVDFTAVSDTGWYFAGWSGAVTGNSNQVAMTISDPNVVVTATFEPFSYTLAVGTVGNGTVSKNPNLDAYIYGDVVTLTANPDPGWYLVAWSGAASGNANPKAITIYGNTVVTATFAKITYTVDTLVQGGVGTVTRVPSQTIYYYGDVVTLSVVPAPCNFFVDWSGDASGTLVQTTVTVTKNMMIYANLTPSTHTVTANVVGLGSVLQLPGQPSYGCETNVMLVAMPASGWKFAGWSGDVSGLNPVANVIINNANVVVTATFEVFTFSLHENIVGNGSVLVDPIHDHESYSYGDVVTLTAVPDPGWYLIGWSGDASGNTNPVNVTITTNKHVTATFGKITYTLDLNTVGNGTAAADPNLATYFYGDVVTLTASANTCSVFSSWSGDASGMNEVTMLTITGNAVVTATFVPGTYTITSNVVGKGEVKNDPVAEAYECGTVKLDAYPAMGWFFTGWSGDASGINHRFWLEIIGRDMVVTATFEPYTYTLDVNIVGNGSVAIDPELNTYIYGDVVTLTASPDPGWYLVGWSGNASGTGNPAVVTIHANTVVTATFARITYTLTTVVHSGIGTVIVSPAQATYYYGDQVTLTAVPEFGWFFIGWTGDVISDHLSVVATIYGNMTVSASFGNFRTFLPLTFTVVPLVLSPE